MLPALGKIIPEAIMAFCMALAYVVSVPITSPVDFISVPKKVSTSVSFEKEKTGPLTVIMMIQE